jgi:hypothetical protein
VNDIEYIAIAALNQYASCSPERSLRMYRIAGEMPPDHEIFFA